MISPDPNKMITELQNLGYTNVSFEDFFGDIVFTVTDPQSNVVKLTKRQALQLIVENQ